jgi:antitoxin VapB
VCALKRRAEVQKSVCTELDGELLLEPAERDIEDIRAIFAEIDRLGGADFLPEGRPEQPPMPPPRAFADE